MSDCDSQKVIFEKKENGDSKAYDIFCGQEYKGYIWYCSLICKELDGITSTDYTNKFKDGNWLGGWGS